MQLSSDYEEDDMDHNQTKDVSLSAQTEDNQKNDPFAISVESITRSKSKKLIQNMACIIQNIDIEDQLLGRANTSSTAYNHFSVS